MSHTQETNTKREARICNIVPSKCLGRTHTKKKDFPEVSYWAEGAVGSRRRVLTLKS